MVHNITGVVLAGGSGKRFNDIIKAKIVIGGSSIISRILNTIGDIFEEIIIVTNTPDEFQEHNNCRIIGDLFLNKGPLGGIHAAMKESVREAVFAFAGDMPLLNREIIFRQIDFYNNNTSDILIPKIEQFIEPLHGIYKNTLTGILEDYLERDNDYTIREFFKKADVRYWKLEGSEMNRRAFTNINSDYDISFVKKLIGF
jgi:molybdopterin-guanine dinucleotide biosynthesis protein A